MTQILGLQSQRKANLEAIELAQALAKLETNKEYKRIFAKELFQDFAAQCVIAKGNPAMQNEAGQKAIDADIAMIGTLASRLNSIRVMGEQAPNVIEGIDLEIERLMSEDME